MNYTSTRNISSRNRSKRTAVDHKDQERKTRCNLSL